MRCSERHRRRDQTLIEKGQSARSVFLLLQASSSIVILLSKVRCFEDRSAIPSHVCEIQAIQPRYSPNHSPKTLMSSRLSSPVSALYSGTSAGGSTVWRCDVTSYCEKAEVVVGPYAYMSFRATCPPPWPHAILNTPSCLASHADA